MTCCLPSASSLSAHVKKNLCCFKALWDQNESLRWVQENISAFGGDPDRVTLAGRGSGAVCVGCHLASRHSAGLFHRLVRARLHYYLTKPCDISHMTV